MVRFIFLLIIVCQVLMVSLMVGFSCAKKQIPKNYAVEKTISFKGTFLEVLSEATKIVQRVHSNARIFEVGADSIDSSGTESSDIKSWVFIYNVEFQKTALIKYSDSIFSNVILLPYPMLDDCVIDTINMDIVEAISIMRKYCYNDKFISVNLRRPIYPECDEPHYIFGCPKTGRIYIGTNSKKIKIVPFVKCNK